MMCVRMYVCVVYGCLYSIQLPFPVPLLSLFPLYLDPISPSVRSYDLSGEGRERKMEMGFGKDTRLGEKKMKKLVGLNVEASGQETIFNAQNSFATQRHHYVGPSAIYGMKSTIFCGSSNASNV